jgi:hypothetical protein
MTGIPMKQNLGRTNKVNDDELQRRYIQAASRGVSSFHLTLADET